jgi:hypothetical protein
MQVNDIFIQNVNFGFFFFPSIFRFIIKSHYHSTNELILDHLAKNNTTININHCVEPPKNSAPHASVGIRKYVIWCLVCGGFSCLLGIMFLGVYFLLRSYTSTVGYFETVPTFVPATLVSQTLFNVYYS